MTKKICILGLEDYPMLAGDGSGHIGGESVQHVLLARAWRDMGLEVSMVLHDLGQPRETVIDGIRGIAAFAPRAGVRIVRFVHPRITGVLRAMRTADADVYYQSPAGAYTGVAAWFARRHRKRLVVRIASDLNCVPGQQLIRYRRDRKLYEYGLRNATLVAAQTERQRTLLREHYGIESAVINMAVERAEPTAPAARDIDVVWLGNLRPVKRPELLLELARRLPHRSFVMAGGSLPRLRGYFDELSRAAARMANVRFLGPVTYADTGALFGRARLHVNTSSAEGFPNTFLQAWARAVPVVSFFDPDLLIERRGFGLRATDVDDMAAAIEALLVDPGRAAALGAAARAYVLAEFAPRQVAQRYLDLLHAAQPRGWSAPATTRIPVAKS